jgi:type IV pilus assembly protein PilN
VLLTLGVLVLAHLQISAMTHYQQLRNKKLENQIVLLNRKIKDIKEIENKKGQLLAKIELIQTLQESRPQIVHLFDELAKTAPDGVFLNRFVQTNKRLIIDGKAKSNARVSAYMRAIEASPWLKDPKLNVIRNNEGDNKTNRLNDFVLFAQQGIDNPKKD